MCKRDLNEEALSAPLLSMAVECGSGIFVGLLAGLLGVGGGIIAVPVLLEVYAWQGVDVATTLPLAIGTSQASMIPTGIAAALSHARAGMIDRNALRFWSKAVLGGAMAGIALAYFAEPRLLTGLFAVVAAALAAHLACKRSESALPDFRPRREAELVVASTVGMLAAALGIGAGTIGIPVMALLGHDLRRAIGLGSTLNVVVAVPAMLGFVGLGLAATGRPWGSLGYVDLPAAAAIGLSSVVAVPIGTRLSRRAPLQALRLCLAACLLFIATRMALQLAGLI